MNKSEIEKHRRLLINLVKEKDLIIKEQKQRIDKAIEYIEQLPFNDLTPLEVKVIYKILGDKENE